MRHFREFCEVTDFTDDRVLSYDPSDIFYWENRVGVWLCLEADIVHETLTFYNNWRLLSTMLESPFEPRETAEVFHRAIAYPWPELSSWPINPKEWERTGLGQFGP